MKKLLLISVLACGLALMGAGCAGGEDESVKAAPEDVPTASADQIGGAKQKGEGGEAGLGSGR